MTPLLFIDGCVEVGKHFCIIILSLALCSGQAAPSGPEVQPADPRVRPGPLHQHLHQVRAGRRQREAPVQRRPQQRHALPGQRTGPGHSTREHLHTPGTAREQYW